MDTSSFTKTAFCGKKIDNVTENKTKEYILKDLSLKTNKNYNSRYAKVLNENYMKNLKNKHIVNVKSGGAPYLLYITEINGNDYSFLIDKKIKQGYEYPKIFVLSYRFSKEVYKGTLFETELVRDNNNNWFLLLGDIYLYSGSSLQNTNIIERINTMHNILNEKYTKIDSIICPPMIKRFFDMNKIKYIIDEFIPSLNYISRGLYFVPLKCSYSNILYLFDRDKSNNIHNKSVKNVTSVNFRIEKTMCPDVYELYLKENDILVKKGLACIPNYEKSVFINELFHNEKKEVYVQCVYNKDFKKWEPMKETDSVDNVSILDHFSS
tara:strand:- start:2569 stop:3537 length:969 start_codon:yes stop_codon:yes gene_type:complete